MYVFLTQVNSLIKSCLFSDGERLLVVIFPAQGTWYCPVGGAAVVLVDDAAVVESLPLNDSIGDRLDR